MLSQSQANFFVNRPIFFDYPHMKEAFSNNSQEILQFLEEDDISNLKLTNKFFLDICDCHQLFSQTMKQLGNLFAISVEPQESKTKKSKFKEKYNFNKPIGVFYKPPENYLRIQNANNKKRAKSASIDNIKFRKNNLKNMRYQIDAGVHK